MAEKLLQPIGCIIHPRVSTSKQSQASESLDDQEKVLRDIADKNGWKILFDAREYD